MQTAGKKKKKKRKKVVGTQDASSAIAVPNQTGVGLRTDRRVLLTRSELK